MDANDERDRNADQQSLAAIADDSNGETAPNKLTIETKKDKRGVVYLSYIPDGMTVARLRQIFAEFGEVDRIFLERNRSDGRRRDRRPGYQRYDEGWVEFKRKRVAKRVADMLNGQQIGGKRKNRFHDCLWNIKYLRKFKWSHLAEQMAYEKALRDQRLRFEISRAKKESNFYSAMIERSNNKKKLKSDRFASDQQRQFKQRVTDEQIRKGKATDNNEVDIDFLNKIFA